MVVGIWSLVFCFLSEELVVGRYSLDLIAGPKGLLLVAGRSSLLVGRWSLEFSRWSQQYVVDLWSLLFSLV